MFDVGKLTLDEIDEEFARTLDKLERLSKLREAAASQDYRRIKKLVGEYNAILAAKEKGGDNEQNQTQPAVGQDQRPPVVETNDESETSSS